jgi:hypothetical protein
MHLFRAVRSSAGAFDSSTSGNRDPGEALGDREVVPRSVQVRSPITC